VILGVRRPTPFSCPSPSCICTGELRPSHCESVERRSCHLSKLFVIFQTLAAEARESERGQTMAEYAVVLSVIAVAIIATLVLVAGGINDTLSSVTDNL
jgi:Flp pilus assembly pilin Flp